MILLMIVILAGVLFYSYSNKVLAGLVAVNGPVTMDSLRIEAYNWDTLSSLVLNLRNTGSNILTISTAQWFVAGVLQTSCTSGSTCSCSSSSTLSPGLSCSETLTLSGVTITSGIVYVAKIVLSDGSIFSTSAIAGEVTGQTGVT